MKKFYSGTLYTGDLKTKGLALVLWLCVFLLGMIPDRSNAQTISVTNITTIPICAGSDVTITFDVTNGIGSLNYYTSATNYQVYLSDNTGTTFTLSGSTFNL